MGGMIATRMRAAFFHVTSSFCTASARPRTTATGALGYIRTMNRLASLVLTAAIASAAPACYGSYGAFNAVHRWNGHATGNKVANSFIHFGLWIIPVYELTLFGDFLIFNNIEYFTGSPMFQ